MPTTNVLLPHDIDLDKCIALNSSYTQARVVLAELPRLQESCVRIEGEVLADISFENDLNSMRLIHGHVVADVVLICQRCGQPFDVSSAGYARAKYCPACRPVVEAEQHAASYERKKSARKRG